MTAPAYPPQWEADVVAADGGTVHLRPIEPSDAAALSALHTSLSPRTRYLRFFTQSAYLSDRDLHRFTNVDHHYRVAFVLLLGGQIIAVGRYEGRPDSTEAEVAFVVADAHQGRGLGSVLLEHLAAAARERGITRFTAVVLAENRRMLRVFTDAGYLPSTHYDSGEVALDFEIGDTALTDSVRREREQRAEARSIRRLLFPASVVVIGASNDESKVGNAVFRNLLHGTFTGPIYPVNPDARHVAGVRAYPTVADVPDEISLAVVAVPAASVPDVVAQCAAQGVHGLVLLSGGFGERGDAQERSAGNAAQRALVRSARAHGMRVVGPNCLGLVNTDPTIALNASLAPSTPLSGRAGFFCQSGALGVAVLGEAARRGLGVSSFVSAGNRADVSGNDLLQYWETDEATDLVLLYMESFGNPRKFARVARRVARHKPIIAVSSAAGATEPALRQNTIQMTSDSVQTLFEASGVIRVDTLGELFDVGLLLAAQPLPSGPRIGIVGNSAALSTLAANACRGERLEVTRTVDVGLMVSAEDLAASVAGMVGDDDVDAVITLFVPTMPLPSGAGDGYADALRTATRGNGKPVLATLLGLDRISTDRADVQSAHPPTGSVPSYPTPERAVRALGKAVRYAQWRGRPVGQVPAFAGIDLDAAGELVSQALARQDVGWLDGEQTAALLRCFGLDLVPSRAVHTLAEAVQVAADAATRVALKVPGAVRLHLYDEVSVTEAWASLDLGVNANAVIQEMAPRGVPIVIDVRTDSSFGAVVSFGVGGLATELLGDRAYATVPLTTFDAEELIAAPKAAPLLSGYGGTEPTDLVALQELALRLSALADGVPEVIECALAGVATASGCFVLEASIRLVAAATRADTGPRRLSGL